jgi:TrmH family RNA methyltransferase
MAEIPKDDLAKIPIKEDLLVVVFDRPSSPGNLGTIIRTCDALGADGLIITGHAVDVYDPETISATTGSLFSLPIVRLPSQKDMQGSASSLNVAVATSIIVSEIKRQRSEERLSRTS